jgi:hypothetical protein
MNSVSAVVGVGVVCALALLAQRPHLSALPPELPRMWDDKEMATIELRLADHSRSPRFVPSEYYYRIRVRPIFKSYPVYAPGHEPPRYLEWLRQQEPVILWDDSGHEPILKRESDWVAAGKVVFDAPTSYHSNSLIQVNDVRDPAWQRRIGGFTAVDGTNPERSIRGSEKGAS